jgi:hypothetical protein
MAAHIAGEALSGNPANLCADHLYCAHKRVGKQERPSQGVAELGASLRIGGYATGIVVRGPGDEARTHDVGELRPVRLFDLVGGWSNIHLKDSAPFERFSSETRRRPQTFRIYEELVVGSRVQSF